MLIRLQSLERTSRLAQTLASNLKAGQFFALCGDLGAGKTSFTRYLTQELECQTLATSPTFSLFQEYEPGLFPVLHADFYRLGSEDELFELGWYEMLERFSKGIVIAEWADKFEESWPKDYLRMNFSYGEDEDSRLVEIKASGSSSSSLAEQLKEMGSEF